MTNAWPDKAMFQSLETKVDGVQASSVPRLRDGGANIGQQIVSTPQTRSYAVLLVRPVILLQSAGLDERDLSELWLQVPAEATQVPELTVTWSGDGHAGPTVLNSGEATYVEADGARWLRIPLRLRLSSANSFYLRVAFAQAYPVLVGADSDQNGQVDTQAFTGPQVSVSVPLGVRFVSEGPRTIVGRLSPDAFPMVSTPTADLPEGAVELVLNATPPYLRTVMSGTEYQLPFVAVDSGGAAT